MARYTETLAQYIANGNSLPPEFAQITGFEDLFKKYYCDHEIGFETETIFALKLEMYADIVIPFYKTKLERIASAWTLWDDPVKTFEDSEELTFTGGAQHGETTDLPINSTSAQPNTMVDNAEYENSQDRTITRTETGSTDDEATRRLEFITNAKRMVMFELLKEFKPCFMNIY